MRDLLLYLSRKKGDYKLGIPVHGAGVTKGKMLFIYEGDTAENKEFLNSLVEKGFKLKSADQSFLAVDKIGDDRVSGADKEGTPWRFIVAFGQKLADRLVPGDSKIIVAPEIEVIKDNREIKKQFWLQIKDL